MKIFQHFCDVFVQYYKIVILNFYCHTFNIVLYNILSQKLLVGQYFLCTLKQIVTICTCKPFDVK